MASIPQTLLSVNAPCNASAFLLAISAAPCYEQYRGENQRGQDTQPMRRGVRTSTIVSIALLLVFLQPAYANGEHVHVGGLFLVLLGGVVFVGSFVVVFYFLLRSTRAEVHEEQEGDE